MKMQMQSEFNSNEFIQQIWCSHAPAVCGVNTPSMTELCRFKLFHINSFVQLNAVLVMYETGINSTKSKMKMSIYEH